MRYGAAEWRVWPFVVAVVVTLLVEQGVDAAPVVDQQQPNINMAVGGLAIGGASQQMLAQVVTAGLSGPLVGIRLPIACDSEVLVVEIQGVEEGIPDGVVLTSETFPAETLPPGVHGFQTLHFSSPVSFTAGDLFAIVVHSTGGCGVFQGPVGDSYAGGAAFFDALPNRPGWVCLCAFAGASFDLPFQTLVDVPHLTTLGPVEVWLGLGSSSSVGIRFDLLAEVYLDGTLVGSGHVDRVSAGFSVKPYFAKPISIPLALVTGPSSLPSGSALTVKVLGRNACSGSARASGTARLWFNGRKYITSGLAATMDAATSTYFLRDGFTLSATPGTALLSVDAAVGAPCGPFVSFGTWAVTLP